MERLQSGVTRGAPVTIDVDGQSMSAYEGESVATALLAGGVRAFRESQSGAPRAPYCNMGVCFECEVEIDGTPCVRACMTPVREGMRVRTRADDGRG
jgi:predicted molibdopterin-dependent oxidoreductase YjgC